MIHQKNYEQFSAICEQIVSHKERFAKPNLEKIILDTVDVNTSNVNLLAHILAESLLKRIDRNLLESKNIYIQEFDIPQVLLFYRMANAYPQVSVSHDIANQYLENEVKNLTEITIFEIGIGKGLQIKKLLSRLTKYKNIRHINLIALDPDIKNIDDSRAMIEELKKESPFTIEYYPINNMLENLPAAEYERIKEISNGNLVINSAYTIHHINHPLNNDDFRTDVFRKLENLKPLIFTLIEPNANHDTESLTKRFHNCWKHFGTVFELIDRADIDVSEKFSIKEKFFGREIRDIFGVSDLFRCERHESYDSWLLRFARANFKPVDFKDMKISLPDYCEYSVSEGITRLGYDNIDLIAIFAYKAG